MEPFGKMKENLLPNTDIASLCLCVFIFPVSWCLSPEAPPVILSLARQARGQGHWAGATARQGSGGESPAGAGSWGMAKRRTARGPQAGRRVQPAERNP